MYESWVNEKRVLSKGIKFVSINAITKLRHLENGILLMLEKFTLDSYDQEDLEDFRLKLLRMFNGSIKNIQFKEGGRIRIKLQDRTIKARKLTEVFNGIEEYFPQITTKERKGKCHEYALSLVTLMADEDKVVTGIASSLVEKTKFLHSWVETSNEEGQEFCIDVTTNVLMPKDDYYYLWHIKPCAEITKKQYIEDLPRLKPIWRIGVKQYLLNREDALKVADKLSQEEQS